MTIGRAVTAAVLVLVVPVTEAAAQAQPPQARINTALARARQVGIPVSLLEAKVAEGRAKGVSLDRVAAAIERRLATLERAEDAMRGRADVGAPDLAVAADALESGVSETVLRTLLETAPRERRVVAVAVLTQLVELGQVPERALERVRRALERGPDALVNLPAEAAGGARGSSRGAGNGATGTNSPGRGIGNGGGSGQGASPSGVPGPGQPPQVGRPGGPSTDRGNSAAVNNPNTGAGQGPPNEPGSGRGNAGSGNAGGGNAGGGGVEAGGGNAGGAGRGRGGV